MRPLIALQNTYERRPIDFDALDGEPSSESELSAIDGLKFDDSDLHNLRQLLAKPEFDQKLSYIFRERKVDFGTQPLAQSLYEQIAEVFIGPGGLERRAEFDSSHFLKYKKITHSLKLILLAAASNQAFLEHLANFEDRGSIIFDFINEISLIGLSKLKAVEIAEIAEKLRIAKIRSDTAESSVVALPAIATTDEDPIDVYDFIRQNYGCMVAHYDGKITITRDLRIPAKEKFSDLIDSVLGLSDFEGEVRQERDGAVLKIRNLENFVLCYDRKTGKKTVKTLNNFLNLIYHLAATKEPSSLDDDYKTLVRKALKIFPPANQKSFKLLRERLFRNQYERFFYAARAQGAGFNFDYCASNPSLESEFREINFTVTGFVLYGKKAFEVNPRDAGKMIMEVDQRNPRRFFLYKPISEELPRFPGIGFSIKSASARTSEAQICQFEITDPIEASFSLPSFLTFFREKHNEYFRIIHGNLESSLRGLKTFVMANLSPSNRLKFPLKDHDFSGDFRDETGVKVELVSINTAKQDLAEFLTQNNKLFLAIEFGIADKIVTIAIKASTYLEKDLITLQDLIKKYNKEKDSAAISKVEEEDWMKQDGGTKTKAARPNGGAGKPKREVGAAAPKKIAPPAPPTKDPKPKFFKFLDDNDSSLRGKLKIGESIIRVLNDEVDKKFSITFCGINNSDEWILNSILRADTKGLEVALDPEKQELTISASLTKLDLSNALGSIKGFLQHEIIEAKPPRPTLPMVPKKAKATKVVLNKPQLPTAAVLEAPEPMEEVLDDETPVLAVGASAETYDFDKEVLELLRLRKNCEAFHPKIISEFPAALKHSIENLCTKPEVLQPALYGGFIYGKNPKDLDFQIVMQNGFFTKKSEKEVVGFFKEIFPAELKIECSKNIIPGTDGEAVWRVEVGELVEFTFIEQRHHLANQNWTSNIDAQIYDLKRQAPCCQPTFLQRFGFYGTEIGHNSFGFPPTINERAKDWPIRLIYETLPSQLTPENNHRAVNYFERFFEKSVEINEDRSIKSFDQRLGEKAMKFLEHHPMSEEDAAIFHRNINEICLLRKSLLEERESKLAHPASTRPTSVSALKPAKSKFLG